MDRREGRREKKETKGKDQEPPKKRAKVGAQDHGHGFSNAGIQATADRQTESSVMGSRDSFSAAEPHLHHQGGPNFGQGIYTIDPSIDLDANIPPNPMLGNGDRFPFFQGETSPYPQGHQVEGSLVTTAGESESNVFRRSASPNTLPMTFNALLDSSLPPSNSTFVAPNPLSRPVSPVTHPPRASIESGDSPFVSDGNAPLSNRSAPQAEALLTEPFPLDSPLSSPGSTMAELPPTADGGLPPVDPATVDYAAAVHGIELSERAPFIEWPGGVKTVVPFIPDDDDETKNVLQLVSQLVQSRWVCSNPSNRTQTLSVTLRKEHHLCLSPL